VDDIFSEPGVDTLEGRIGPLLAAARGACHFIELPAGGYCEEHAHPTESLIYTARGQWVLSAAGERRHMREGSLFWFGDNVPTGYEIPFDEPATILIFKTQAGDGAEAFLEHLHRMAAELEADHEGGTPFRLSELPDDHPARVFAAGLVAM
jgi:quercetin dioxygenase-like cupin family protein